MADKKISALTGAATPLAGTEVLPIVQSGATVKVAVSDLTAGRSFDALGMTLTSTDAGATASPLLELYRDSATPAALDTLGEIEFNGEDSAGNKQAYGLIHGSILSPTSTAEQGQLHFETATAGALTEKMIIGTTNLVINEIGAVFNVRIEGDTDANLFYTDATNSRVGIGTISPAQKLEVAGNVQSSGNAIFSTSGKGILGTTTNNNADAGVVGEFVSSTVLTGSAVTINYGGSGVPVTSISLTAGDWDVTGWVGYNIGAASVVTYLIQGVSTSDTSITGETTNVYNQIASTTPQIPVVIQRFSIASTTTVYLNSATGGSGTALTAYGTIRARRIR
jgi:hypothetical protein